MLNEILKPEVHYPTREEMESWAQQLRRAPEDIEYALVLADEGRRLIANNFAKHLETDGPVHTRLREIREELAKMDMGIKYQFQVIVEKGEILTDAKVDLLILDPSGSYAK